MKKILSVLTFLTWYLHLPYSHGVKSSCMAPPVKLWDEATLSCHFEEDMGKLQHDVLVYLYKEDNEHPVVIYSWHDGQAKIQAMAGFRCEDNISDYLVIKIVNVTESNAGQYKCIVALSKDESTICTLRIIGLPPPSSIVTVGKVTNGLLGVKSSCMAPPVKLGDNATLSCHFEEDMGKLQHDVLVYLYKEDNELPVVIYLWHEGQAKIQAMAGYRCKDNISDYLVIKIVNVTESNAGQYKCLVALSKDESTTCTLRIIGLPPPSSIVTVGKVTNGLLDSMTSFIVTESHGIQTQQTLVEHQASHWNNLHIAVIVLGALFGVLVVIFLTILIIAISNRWIPTCCSTQTHHDSLNNDATKNGNLKHIYKSTPIYKFNTKKEDKLKQKLVDPV